MDDRITGGEFGRFRADQQAWQTRLEGQLHEGFNGVHVRLDDINDRTRKNSEAIIRGEVELEALKAKGCGLLEEHRDLVLGVPAANGFVWTKKHTGVTVGAGTAILAVIEVIQHLLKLP